MIQCFEQYSFNGPKTNSRHPDLWLSISLRVGNPACDRITFVPDSVFLNVYTTSDGGVLSCQSEGSQVCESSLAGTNERTVPFTQPPKSSTVPPTRRSTFPLCPDQARIFFDDVIASNTSSGVAGSVTVRVHENVGMLASSGNDHFFCFCVFARLQRVEICAAGKIINVEHRGVTSRTQ